MKELKGLTDITNLLKVLQHHFKKARRDEWLKEHYGKKGVDLSKSRPSEVKTNKPKEEDE